MNRHYKFENKPLPYAYDAIEPYIDTKTMELHHDKHLQTYVDNLNKLLENYLYLQEWTLEQLVVYADLLPEEIRTPVQNNAGGIYNHEFYFNELGNLQVKEPIGRLRAAIDRDFGSYKKFKAAIEEKGLSVFGSGYAWLVAGAAGNLEIITMPNQETPLTRNVCPILALDVWEHAYYLKHYNVRAAYIEDWLLAVDWEKTNQTCCFL